MRSASLLLIALLFPPKASAFLAYTAFWAGSVDTKCNPTDSTELPARIAYRKAGTYTFKIPSYTTLKVEVRGAGGGGGAYNGNYYAYPITAPAAVGEVTSFNGTVVAMPGGPGHGCNVFESGVGFPGADGVASGGDTNLTGGGGAGGYGTWATPQNYNCAVGSAVTRTMSMYRSHWVVGVVQMNSTVRNVSTITDIQIFGGSGGLATKTYAPSDLPAGSLATIVVGRGGQGETTAWKWYTGYDGEPGCVKINW